MQARLKEIKEKEFSNFLKSIENVEFVTEHIRENESTFNVLLGENTEFRGNNVSGDEAIVVVVVVIIIPRKSLLQQNRTYKQNCGNGQLTTMLHC